MISPRAKSLPLWLALVLAVLLGLAGVAAPKREAGTRTTAPKVDRRKLMPPLHSVKGMEKYRKFLADNKIRARTGYWGAYLHWMKQRAYPNDRVDMSAYQRGIAHRERMPAAQMGGGRGISAAAANRWEFLGPNGIPAPYRIYFGQGFASGRVNGISYDPTNPNTLWAAAAWGGVHKSTDGGQNWRFLSGSWPSLETSALTIHPTNGNIVYVGTGDFDGFVNAFPMGIMKTTDGGNTWTNLGRSQFGEYGVRRIALDPESPNTVIATAGRWTRDPFSPQGRVWRSTDGGQNWTAVITTGANWSDVEFGAAAGNGSRRLYAVGEWTFGGEVWRSDDRGATWTRLTSPLDNRFRQEGMDIATSPTDPDTVYLLGAAQATIHKSTDAGQTWTEVTNNFPHGDGFLNWNQYWYDWYIHCTKRPDNNGDVVIVGLLDVAASFDGGASWQSVAHGLTDQALVHVDQHSIATNPTNPLELTLGNDGGVYRMTLNPTGKSATFNTTLNRTLGITQFYAADFHPTDPNVMLGGTQDNSTPTSTGDLQNWVNPGVGDGGGCAINPLNPNIQYNSSQGYGTILRTGNRWATAGVNITPGANFGNDALPFIGKMTIDPSNPNRVYIGTNYIWRWNDDTSSWTERLGNQRIANDANATVSAIAVARSDGNYIYAGSDTGELWMTSNGGTSWTKINPGSPGLPNRAITSIAVHPTNPKAILVGVSGTGTGHLWRLNDTTAGSRVWVNVSGNGTTALPDISLNAIALDTQDPTNRYYVGTDLGLFRSTDAGATWENATGPLGLPNVAIYDLKIVPGTGYLMAATHAKGMWRINPRARATDITITAPTVGVLVGRQTEIRWTSLGFDPGHLVKIELSRNDGGNWTTLAASTPDDGSFLWTPDAPTSTQARLRITSLTDPGTVGLSNLLTIAQGSLTVTAPNGGERLIIGNTATVTWSTSGSASDSPDVQIEVSRDNGATWSSLLDSTPNDGTEGVVITGPSSETARIRVTALDQPVFTDTSDASFTIRDPSTVAVVSPNGGETLVVGDLVPISWASTGFTGNVKIELSRDGGATYETLFPDADNGTKTVTWRVTGPDAPLARLRISSLEEPNVVDVSNGTFRIEVPSITVDAPVAGTVSLIGQPLEINWSSTGLTAARQVKIEISRDGGQTWTSISDSTGNDGSFTWTGAAPEAASAVVRVSSVDDPAVNGVSSAFSVSAPTIFVVNPNGKEKWKLGNQHQIRWSGTSVGVGTVTIQLSRNGGRTWTTILDGIENDGGEYWGVHGAASDKARLRIIWNVDGNVRDASNRNFSIVRGSAKKNSGKSNKKNRK
ncbi:MAG: VPS10 domain-containing protein [Armatimonadota bacterium]